MLRNLFLYLFAGLLGTISLPLRAQNPKTYIHPNAVKLIPLINDEQDRLMPDTVEPAYVIALAEHESCITLKHSRCLNSLSRLKSQREEGAGFFQLTRAYDINGKLRFDKLAELRQQYRDELRELSWGNVYDRPDLQIKAAVLMIKDLNKGFYAIQNPFVRFHFVDAAYNGGKGGVDKERRACGLAKNCDPQFWFGNVDRYCLKSKKPLYGGRSACDINRHHVKDVFETRLPKYRDYYRKNGFYRENIH